MNEINEMNWFDKHSKGTKILFDIHYEIAHYAKAFRATGNETMYQTLMDISDEIFNAHKMIRDAIGESIHENFKRSEENTATILKAALAGCLLERQGSDTAHH